jgi:polygalacturonase
MNLSRRGFLLGASALVATATVAAVPGLSVPRVLEPHEDFAAWFQDAIEKAKANGSYKVHIPAGTYRLPSSGLAITDRIRITAYRA